MPGTPYGHQIADGRRAGRNSACRRSLGLPSRGVAINPLRECPQIDDWAYAATVWHWLNTGQYQLNE